MKFFIDTANVDEIREAASLGVLDGVTTNPTLLGREIERTHRRPEDILREICEIVNGPVSAEGVSLDAEGIVKEGKELAKIHKNICIKVPMTPDGMKAIRKFRSLGITTNTTLVFSCNQALIAAKAGTNYLSPFIGRLDDAGHSGMELVDQILTMLENYEFDSQLIVASIRHPLHVVEASLIGAHICTIPFKVIKLMFKHPLTDQGIKRFLEDWERAKKFKK
ncbi:fructose-6-phosphate aldolase [candidate division WOR-3 bacterium]|nr:fructose-6-phosphate aldolase [candidate division WOR-3 bacterium]